MVMEQDFYERQKETALTTTTRPPRLRPRKPMGPYFRAAGKGVGRGVKAVGKGIFEAGAGFAEGVGLRRIRISPRGVGRLAGSGVRETIKTAGRVEFKGPEYFWGKGTEERKFTPSKLPIEVQHSMISLLSEMYPEAYKALWTPGIRMSDFIGKLRAYYPDIYEDLKALTYSQLAPRYYPPYGQPPTGYPPTGYPPMGGPMTMY